MRINLIVLGLAICRSGIDSIIVVKIANNPVAVTILKNNEHGCISIVV